MFSSAGEIIEREPHILGISEVEGFTARLGLPRVQGVIHLSGLPGRPLDVSHGNFNML
jgi:hypothetical protein